MGYTLERSADREKNLEWFLFYVKSLSVEEKFLCVLRKKLKCFRPSSLKREATIKMTVTSLRCVSI